MEWNISKKLDFGAFLLAAAIYCVVVFAFLTKVVDTQRIFKFSSAPASFIDVYMVEPQTPRPQPAQTSQPADPAAPNSNLAQPATQTTPAQPDIYDSLFADVDADKLREENLAKNDVAQLDPATLAAAQSPAQELNITPAPNQTATANAAANVATPAPNLTQELAKVAQSVQNVSLFELANIPAATEDKRQQQLEGEFDAFFSDFEKELQRRWVRYKANGNDRVDVRIVIDTQGRLIYAVTKPSYSRAFNAKVRDFLDGLKATRFPAPPKNMVIETRLIDRIN